MSKSKSVPENTISQVFVASARPPHLYGDANINKVLKFIEEFTVFRNLGGSVPMIHCVDHALLAFILPNDLTSEFGFLEPVKPLTDVQFFKFLKKYFCPTSVEACSKIFSKIFCQGDHTFSAAHVSQYISRFQQVVMFCETVLPPAKLIKQYLFANLKSTDFVEFCRLRGLEHSSLDEVFKKLSQASRDYQGIVSSLPSSFRQSTSSLVSKPHFRDSSPRSSTNGSASVAAISATPPSVPTSQSSPRPMWDRNMCLGCGHVTSPPHRRHNCPHKSCSGWLASGIPSRPISIRSSVAAISAATSQVSIVPGIIAPSVDSLSTGVDVTVGLDTMSSFSLVSPAIFERLRALGVSACHSETPQVVHTAGDYESKKIDTFVAVSLKLSPPSGESVVVSLSFGVFPIPSDVLISWTDMLKFKLLGLLHDLGGVELSEEIAPEDSVVEAVTSSALFPKSVARLLSEFGSVFSQELPAEPARVPAMEILLKDPSQQLVSLPPRRQSPAVRAFVRDTVLDLLSKGFIVPSTSPVASPVVVVRAPGKDWRMCCDFRGVNEVTSNLLHPLPNLKGILSRTSGRAFFAKLDLRKGYNQTLVDTSSRYLTAFVTEEGQFEYVRVPFGLKNAPSYFQRVISSVVLAGLVGVICEVYIDDVITYGDTEEQLFENLSIILTRFREYNLVLHPDKCVLGVEEIEFLGHLISRNGIKLSESKKQGLLSLVCPIDITTLKSFIGLANYFRDFIPNFSSRCSRLHVLASPRVPFVWTEAHTAEFEDIRQAIQSAPMLHHIDYSLPIVLRTDASNTGIGATLLNIDDGVDKPICFLSKKLSGPASRWSTIDQEAFAIFHGITSLSHYLRGHPFMVETDHNNLVYIQKSQDGRVGRWRLALQEYTFIVRHIPGVTNVVADALSRCCAVIADDKLELLNAFHNDVAGHRGIAATIKSLTTAGHKWSTLRQDVVSFIHDCPLCQKLRITAVDNSVAENHVIESYEPFQEISLDSIVALPEDSESNSCILVVIDNFTKFIELFPMPDLSAVSAAKALLSIIGRYGMVQFIRSDRGGQFVSEIFQALVKFVGSSQILTIGYRPQANGIVERSNAEIMRHLTAIVQNRRLKSMWSFALPIVQRIINATIHSSTGCAPATLLFGERIHLDRAILTPFNPSESVSIPAYVQAMYRFQLEAIKASQLHMATIMDSRVRPTSDMDPKAFQLSDYVLVSPVSKPAKFSFKWLGPYSVVARDGNTYDCMDLRTRQVHQFDVSRLRIFNCPADVDPLSIATLDVDEDVVESVLSYQAGRKGRRSHKFLVKFMDSSEFWLPYEEVKNLEALDVYLEAHPDVRTILKL